MKKLITRGTVLVSCLAALSVAQVRVDYSLPEYRAGQGVSGSIKSVGSDTMNNLMTQWFEEFRKYYPNVRTEVEGKGSSTAPPALIEGQAQLGPMSRPMKASEIDAFERRVGYKPTELSVAIDALAVFVHKDCPLESMTLEQIRRVFSVDGKDMTWGDLGVTDPAWSSKLISLYGRNSASGTYGFFKEHGLSNRDFKASVKEQPGSSSVVQGIATDRFAMGYSGIGYATADVKALKVAVEQGDEAFPADPEHCYSGEYPLARFLYLYINHRPGGSLEPLRSEFIRMLFSKQGQEVVIKDGYIPVGAEVARLQLRGVGIEPGF